MLTNKQKILNKCDNLLDLIDQMQRDLEFHHNRTILENIK